MSLELLQSDRDLEGKAWTTPEVLHPWCYLAVALTLWAFSSLLMSVLVFSAHSILETKGDTACRHS